MEGSMRNELKNALELGLVENDAFKDVDIGALSKSIEEDFLKVMSGKSGRIIRQRRFELMSNLKRSNNSDLRRRILTGEMTVRQFVTCPVSELAPDSVKQQRLEEQKRYFKEECILMKSDRDSADIKDKKRSGSFDEIDNGLNEYYNENEKGLTEGLESELSGERKEKKLKRDDGRELLDTFPDLPLSLAVPPDLSHITPKFNLNKFIDKYKDMVKDINIQNELIKQAKLRIVTTT
ncbi:transcription factor s-ii (tfiis), central domain-containing protein [Cryptosporidium felis]|nr:transcription factor s-ii (tfiis), central domain-containing protein [Cryptosporidium felis]